jgi:hypothetical protein
MGGLHRQALKFIRRINEGRPLGHVDGFDEDEAQSKRDEGAVVLIRLLAT